MLAKSPDPQASTLLFNWEGHWVSLVALAVQVGATAWYLGATLRVKRAGRSWPPVRGICFVAGMAVVAYAMEGGIARYQTDNFTVHVVQLLLLLDVAPVLLTIGAPLRLALQSARGRAGRRLAATLHSAVARAISHPLVAFAVYMASVYSYFLTPWYRSAAGQPLFLAYVDTHFLVSGCLLWWVIIARDALPRVARTGARFALVVVSIPFNAFLGLTIGSMSRPLYPAGNTLADTSSGGNVLWGLAEVFTVAALGLLFVDWAREEERRAVRADRQLDAALAAARTMALADGPDGEEG